MRPNPTTCYQLAMDSVANIPAPKRHRTRTTILTTIPTLAVIALAALASILVPTACQPTPPPTTGSMAPDVLATVATDMQRCTTSGWQCHAEWNGDRAGWDVIATAPMPACATEDSTGPCQWDATTRGNGNGRSFTRTSDGTTVYQ
jgi:hypothetical protein